MEKDVMQTVKRRKMEWLYMEQNKLKKRYSK